MRRELSSSSATRPPRLWIPEVVQTSAMDCGPAALKALLEGFHIHASYGRLREACQTDVDGTSIDTLEEIAVQLGLNAVQLLIPTDHLLAGQAPPLPALVVFRLPNGLPHFVVAWRRHRYFVQVMDPARGRRWLSRQAFERECYVHKIPLAAEVWREWAGGEHFLAALRSRMARQVGASKTQIEAWVQQAIDDPTWVTLAALDAATRMTGALTDTRALKKGREGAGALRALFARASTEGTAVIPEPFWSACSPKGASTENLLTVRGAVVIRAYGTAEAAARRKDSKQPAGEKTSAAEQPPATHQRLSAELVAALEEPPARPGRDLCRLLLADGLLHPTVLVMSLIVAGGAMALEAFLLRGLLEVGTQLGSGLGRLGAISAVVVFSVLLLLLELPVVRGSVGLGRQLETRLRIAFLEKIPRLNDRYFASRLISDMAQRSHAIHQVRQLPELGRQLLRAGWLTLLTAGGIIWLDPGSAPLAMTIVLTMTALPWLVHPLLTERDLRVRSHAGALSRFHLDGLLGQTPIHTHGAERAVRRGHEALLTEWARAGRARQRVAVTGQGVQMLLGYALAAWLLKDHLARAGASGGALLLIYWTLRLPTLGQSIALLARQYPAYRNVTQRLLEPLAAPEADRREREVAKTVPTAEDHHAKGVAIELNGVRVMAGGHVVLSQLDLAIDSGSEVAIVGPSGAGKSSLVGLLLGWHRPQTGELRIDGKPCDAQRLDRLRCETAWIDPAVQIWNRSLLHNLRYGAIDESAGELERCLRDAELYEVLRNLPEGLQTPLGEGGGLVSGGEGQRVRLGRSLSRVEARLVILDEAFRGLDRPTRRKLLARARELWADATFLFVSHDIEQTLGFPRVLVIEQGRLVEDGAPRELLAQPGSRFCDLMQTEERVREELWSDERWRRLTLRGGDLEERGAP